MSIWDTYFAACCRICNIDKRPPQLCLTASVYSHWYTWRNTVNKWGYTDSFIFATNVCNNKRIMIKQWTVSIYKTTFVNGFPDTTNIFSRLLLFTADHVNGDKPFKWGYDPLGFSYLLWYNKRTLIKCFCQEIGDSNLRDIKISSI